jgi:type I restriction enzyme R subunit
MSARAEDTGITFVAFTATPKNKTMELFGTRPDPRASPPPTTCRAVPRLLHAPGHRGEVHPRRAAELHALQLAFKLAHEGKEIDDKEVERSAALKKIMGWVKLHPYNIAQKVQVVVEHFREHVAPLLGGKAKAMVVVSSRIEAVRWQLAIEKYIKEHGYKIGTLVAFSGEVNDKESGPTRSRRTAARAQPASRAATSARPSRATSTSSCSSANKFQTGFDQPLLCGMYVDKRLAGIQAVQTLSRLNRAHPGKDTTYVLDFVNDPSRSPRRLQDLPHDRRALGDHRPEPGLRPARQARRAGHYDDFEVDRVVAVELEAEGQAERSGRRARAGADRVMKRYKAAQEALEAAKAKRRRQGCRGCAKAR